MERSKVLPSLISAGNSSGLLQSRYSNLFAVPTKELESTLIDLENCSNLYNKCENCSKEKRVECERTWDRKFTLFKNGRR